MSFGRDMKRITKNRNTVHNDEGLTQQSVMSKNAKFELEVVNSLKSCKVSPETALWQNRNAKLDFSICNVRLCPFF